MYTPPSSSTSHLTTLFAVGNTPKWALIAATVSVFCGVLFASLCFQTSALYMATAAFSLSLFACYVTFYHSNSAGPTKIEQDKQEELPDSSSLPQEAVSSTTTSLQNTPEEQVNWQLSLWARAKNLYEVVEEIQLCITVYKPFEASMIQQLSEILGSEKESFNLNPEDLNSFLEIPEISNLKNCAKQKPVQESNMSALKCFQLLYGENGENITTIQTTLQQKWQAVIQHKDRFFQAFSNRLEQLSDNETLKSNFEKNKMNQNKFFESNNNQINSINMICEHIKTIMGHLQNLNGNSR